MRKAILKNMQWDVLDESLYLSYWIPSNNKKSTLIYHCSSVDSIQLCIDALANLLKKDGYILEIGGVSND